MLDYRTKRLKFLHWEISTRFREIAPNLSRGAWKTMALPEIQTRRSPLMPYPADDSVQSQRVSSTPPTALRADLHSKEREMFSAKYPKRQIIIQDAAGFHTCGWPI